MRKSARLLPDSVFKTRLGSIHQRARKAQQFDRLEIEDLQYVYRVQWGLCFWCFKPVGLDFEIDHIINYYLGGTNTLANICVSCPTCNRRKGQLSVKQWVSILASEGINHPLNGFFGFQVQMRLPFSWDDIGALPVAA